MENTKQQETCTSNSLISAAFVRAQKSFGPALKTSVNPHYKNKYCSLDACIEAVIDGFHANGIAIIQRPHLCESGVTIETVFIHESGQTLSGGIFHTPAQKNDPQGYGSAMTYARRYSLMAACGIAPEDDDGNYASRPREQAKPAPTLAKPAAPETAKAKCWNLVKDKVSGDSFKYRELLAKMQLIGEDTKLSDVTEEQWTTIHGQLSAFYAQ
jgi:ERF superfamily